jgi:hypothetical protein
LQRKRHTVASKQSEFNRQQRLRQAHDAINRLLHRLEPEPEELWQEAQASVDLMQFEWSIEEYHRGLKQCCGVEKAQVRSARAQRNHIGLAIRAFLRLEIHWFNTGMSWYESKLSIDFSKVTSICNK